MTVNILFSVCQITESKNISPNPPPIDLGNTCISMYVIPLVHIISPSTLSQLKMQEETVTFTILHYK